MRRLSLSIGNAEIPLESWPGWWFVFHVEDVALRPIALRGGMSGGYA